MFGHTGALCGRNMQTVIVSDVTLNITPIQDIKMKYRWGELTAKNFPSHPIHLSLSHHLLLTWLTVAHCRARPINVDAVPILSANMS